MEAMEACPVCGQLVAEGERVAGEACNPRCQAIRREANGEALRLFEPVATIPGQIAMAEGEADG
jgi:predicted nucleic acid-binding Zn ribbon protein